MRSRAMKHKYICEDCGKEFIFERYKPEGRRTCIDCSYKRIEEAALQLHKREGPYYEKWKQAMKHSADAL